MRDHSVVPGLISIYNARIYIYFLEGEFFMKFYLPLVFVGSFIAVMALSSGCAKKKSPSPEKKVEAPKAVKEMGEKAAGKLLQALKKELMATVKEKGPAGAVSFCHLQALPRH